MTESISKGCGKHLLLGVCILSALTSSQAATAKHVVEPSDNSGRQIAAVIPGMPRPITIAVPNLAPKPANKAAAPLIQNHGRTTTITVPKSLEEAADAAWVVSNKFAKASYQKVMEVWKWVAAWYKQNHSPPIATPMGSPYVQGPVHHEHQLYYTNEGRLKTVVKR
ncbi:MAG: hypothetical protein C0507_15320 [Cyanobacteria bacterium PR.3.49]|jgi:hypothetical protein|nr:hypothetical protein [Cyanobacteria bacterium PR.3.49]